MDEDEVQTVHLNKKNTIFSRNKALQKDQLRVLLEDYKARSFYWRLLSECGIYKRSFTGDNVTFFNEGKRHIGLWLLEELFESAPEAYAKMQSEALEREARDKLEMLNQEEKD